MRNYKTTFLLLINLLLGLQLFAQTDSSYIYLDDPSGIRPSGSERIALEAAADSLVAALPTAYQSQFKVFEGGIYPILAYTDGGVEESWEKLKTKAAASSSYYLLIVGIHDNNGKTTWKADIKLPTTNEFQCFTDELKVKVISTLLGSMNFKEFTSTENKLQSIDYLIKIIHKIIDCECNFIRQGQSCSLDADKYTLIGMGFKRIPISNIQLDSSWQDGNHKIFDFANKRFTLNGEDNISIAEQVLSSKIIFDSQTKTVVDSNYVVINDSTLTDTTEFVDESYNETLDLIDQQYISGNISTPTISVSAPLNGHVYILDDLCLQNGKFNNAISLCGNDTVDYVEIYVIVKESEDRYSLYYRYFLTAPTLETQIIAFSDTSHSKLETRGIPTSPLQAALQILGNAAIDAFFQTVEIYLTDDKANTFSEAFYKVNFYSAAWEGVSSLLPWSSVKGWKAKLAANVFQSVVSSLAVVIHNAKTDQYYTAQKGCVDFFKSFGTSVLVAYTGTILSKGASLVTGAVKWTANNGVIGHIGCKLLGYVGLKFGCFPAGTPVLIGNNKFKNIEDIHLQDFLISKVRVEIGASDANPAAEDEFGDYPNFDNDPYVSPDQLYRDSDEFSEGDWSEVSFVDGKGKNSCKLMLPNAYMEENNLSKIGDEYMINNIEYGQVSNYKITSIKHVLPQKIPDEEELNAGYVKAPVTGIFEHTVNQLICLKFSSGDTLRLTLTHPVYSVDDANWKPASEVKVGENVVTYSGQSEIASITTLSGEFKVYTLEVRNYHNFLVGSSSVLVHNNCWGGANKFLYNLTKSQQIQNISKYWSHGFPQMFYRGVFFEKILRKTKFKDWNFTGMANGNWGGLNISNFYLIDFFKDGIVASLKTTKITNVNSWLSLSTAQGLKNRAHIEGLVQGLKKGAFTQTSKGGGIKLNNINAAELHIVVPNINAINQTLWRQEIKKIAKLKGFSDEIINKLSIKFSTMEQYIN